MDLDGLNGRRKRGLDHLVTGGNLPNESIAIIVPEAATKHVTIVRNKYRDAEDFKQIVNWGVAFQSALERRWQKVLRLAQCEYGLAFLLQEIRIEHACQLAYNRGKHRVVSSGGGQRCAAEPQFVTGTVDNMDVTERFSGPRTPVKQLAGDRLAFKPVPNQGVEQHLGQEPVGFDFSMQLDLTQSRA